jgi:hypothetical protein
MEAIGSLAGGVAHDLNNILPSLISFPDVILMDLPEDSPLRKPVLSIEIRRGGCNQDLLTFARRAVPSRHGRPQCVIRSTQAPGRQTSIRLSHSNLERPGAWQDRSRLSVHLQNIESGPHAVEAVPEEEGSWSPQGAQLKKPSKYS